jgi:hypothetical protein
MDADGAQAQAAAFGAVGQDTPAQATSCTPAHPMLSGVVESDSTTAEAYRGRAERSTLVAFVRRKGNSYYLVHNVRRRGRVQQLHLATLGDQPRITREVVRKVSQSHPLLDLNWTRLRDAMYTRVELFDPRSEFFQKLVLALRQLNLDLADFSPALLQISSAPGKAEEVVRLMRFLRSTLEIKLGQLENAGHSLALPERRFR